MADDGAKLMGNQMFSEAIERVLAARPQGLTEREIRRALLDEGLRLLPVQIREILRADSRRFVALSGGLWRLRAVVQTEDVAAGSSDEGLRDERGDVVVPYLTTLPSLNEFVAFDLETTGIRPDRDQIIQIAAVRIVGGEPVGAEAEDGSALGAVFNEYVRLDGDRKLSYGLKLKLGFVDHADWEEELDGADVVGEVLKRFRQWVGDLPLVAHNAEFDHTFIKQAADTIGWEIKNRIVDTMELACLGRPELRTFQLEKLAEALGVGKGLDGGIQVERWAEREGVEAFSWTGFHNAVVDVLVLAAMVPRLVAAIRKHVADHPGLCSEFWRLVPGVAEALGLADEAIGEDRDAVSRNLIRSDPAPTERSEPLPFAFSAKAVRRRFEAMIEEQGLRRRASQLEMVEGVSRGLLDGRTMAIEAPTGTGKTFAYLVPSVLWARTNAEPVVISTYTRLLQDQMVEDLKKLNDNLGVEFRAQVLKGMANYVCPERLAAVYAQTEVDGLDDEERFAWLYVLSWLACSQHGMLDELSYWASMRFPALDRLRISLRAEWGECPSDRQERCPQCFHRRAWETAKVADLVVLNHALLLSKEWGEDSLAFGHVMVDEAHNLEDSATDAATEEVSMGTILYLVNRLLDRRSGQGALVRLRDKVRDQDGQSRLAVAFHKRNVLAGLTVDFGDQLRRYVELNRTKVDARYGAKLALDADPRRANPVSWAPVEEARGRLCAALRETASVVWALLGWIEKNPLPRYQEETLNELRYLADKLGEQATLLESLLRVGYDRLVWVHWVEVERANPFEVGEEETPYEGPYKWAAKRAPVRVDRFLQEQLFEGMQTLVLTSATLRTTQEAGFGFVLERLGLAGQVAPEDAIALAAELDYSRALFGIARYMRADARPSEIQNFTDEVGQELGWFFRFTGGNGLALFTARDRMQDVFGKLESTLGDDSIPVWCQGETGGRLRVLEEIKTRPGSVVLGLKSFWEGVDVPGPNLCYVIMEKLPFPMLGEPVIRARAAEVRETGQHEFADYILPLMLVDFKQGFGRLIRDEEDVGAVLLLDKRVWNRDYRRDLEAALPGAGEGHGKEPQVMPDEIQSSREAVYRRIYEHMNSLAPTKWRIDFDRMREILAKVPEELLTRLEQLLAELRFPAFVPLERLRELWDKVRRGLLELFGFVDWKVAEQKDVVETLLTGRDALVVLPTGSGKSLTFQLPALLREGTTLVFSPLKALMKDQVDKLIDKQLTVADRVDSSQRAEEQERVYQRMREGTTRLVYVAPERVRDPKLMAALRGAKNIVQVVVDEAHCVHMWGRSFRPDFLYISQLVDVIETAQGRRPPVAALTATATPAVQESIKLRLALENPAVIVGNPNRPELRFVVYNKRSSGFTVRSQRDKLRILLRILRRADRDDESAIVYVNTTREAERLAGRLETAGLDARFYHGQMDDQARKDVQDMFLEGQIQTIVATKAFGMGIDKPNIRYVVHYQMPGDIESYFQEAGRAGRDGKVSWCVLLYHSGDLRIHEEYFIPNSLPDQEQVENVLDWLRRRWERSGWAPIYVDPRSMADALGFDEDRELGIHLHILEEQGFVRRGVDVTLKASGRLLTPLASVAARAREMAPGPVGEAVGGMLREQGISEVARCELQVVEGTRAAGVEPESLDDVLYRLALEGRLIYRSFARAFTLAPGPKAKAGEALDLRVGEIQRVRGEMGENLAAMRRYGESLGRGDCLRAEILRHLGAEKPTTRSDACCSLCDVNLGVPWSQEPLWEDVSDPSRYQDAKYAVLKAAAWNAGLADVRGRAPYGTRTLGWILLGNDYQATRWTEDPERQKARHRQILASEHYGVLEGLKGGDSTVSGLVDELCREGYMVEVERAWNRNSYRYPAPTEKGRNRLEEGRLFG